ncbi:MAG: oxygenase MpaB family protein [Betaproteobacteria bacterium]
MNPSSPAAGRLGRLTGPLQRRLARLVYPAGTHEDDFLQPPGEPAMMAADSVSWRVFSNPVALFVGGVTAVLLELAEPRVRTGVWEHTRFRERPLERLQRTGYASMMTVFGARSRALSMIERINQGHARMAGRTPAGVAFRASDDDLLTWVHATATFGFLGAYTRCVRPLTREERDRYYAESRASADAYGVATPPGSESAVEALFERMRPHLEPSAIIGEFLAIMGTLRLLPAPLRPLQAVLIKAAVQCLPAWTRERLGLAGAAWVVPRWQWALLRVAGRAADHLSFPTLPAMLARRRLAAAPDESPA